MRRRGEEVVGRGRGGWIGEGGEKGVDGGIDALVEVALFLFLLSSTSLSFLVSLEKGKFPYYFR